MTADKDALLREALEYVGARHHHWMRHDPDLPIACSQCKLASRITAALKEKADRKDAKDAERFRKLQNMPIRDAQALFCNIKSRRQRAAAIDKLPPPKGE